LKLRRTDIALVTTDEPTVRAVEGLRLRHGFENQIQYWYARGGFIEYKPEQFPGVVYRPKRFDSVLFVFGSGNTIVTGSGTGRWPRMYLTP